MKMTDPENDHFYNDIINKVQEELNTYAEKHNDGNSFGPDDVVVYGIIRCLY